MDDEPLLLFADENCDDVVEVMDAAATVVSKDQTLHGEGQAYPTRFCGRSSSFAASSCSRVRLADAGVLAIGTCLLWAFVLKCLVDVVGLGVKSSARGRIVSSLCKRPKNGRSDSSAVTQLCVAQSICESEVQSGHLSEAAGRLIELHLAMNERKTY